MKIDIEREEIGKIDLEVFGGREVCVAYKCVRVD
jgi:hypothetical protein